MFLYLQYLVLQLVFLSLPSYIFGLFILIVQETNQLVSVSGASTVCTSNIGVGMNFKVGVLHLQPCKAREPQGGLGACSPGKVEN